MLIVWRKSVMRYLNCVFSMSPMALTVWLHTSYLHGTWLLNIVDSTENACCWHFDLKVDSGIIHGGKNKVCWKSRPLSCISHPGGGGGGGGMNLDQSSIRLLSIYRHFHPKFDWSFDPFHCISLLRFPFIFRLFYNKFLGLVKFERASKFFVIVVVTNKWWNLYEHFVNR